MRAGLQLLHDEHRDPDETGNPLIFGQGHHLGLITFTTDIAAWSIDGSPHVPIFLLGQGGSPSFSTPWRIHESTPGFVGADPYPPIVTDARPQDYAAAQFCKDSRSCMRKESMRR